MVAVRTLNGTTSERMTNGKTGCSTRIPRTDKWLKKILERIKGKQKFSNGWGRTDKRVTKIFERMRSNGWSQFWMHPKTDLLVAERAKKVWVKHIKAMLVGFGMHAGLYAQAQVSLSSRLQQRGFKSTLLIDSIHRGQLNLKCSAIIQLWNWTHF